MKSTCKKDNKNVSLNSNSNLMQNSSSQNEEKRVSFIEIPFSSTNGPDPPFMENEIFNLMK